MTAAACRWWTSPAHEGPPHGICWVLTSSLRTLLLSSTAFQQHGMAGDRPWSDQGMPTTGRTSCPRHNKQPRAGTAKPFFRLLQNHKPPKAQPGKGTRCGKPRAKTSPTPWLPPQLLRQSSRDWAIYSRGRRTRQASQPMSDALRRGAHWPPAGLAPDR